MSVSKKNNRKVIVGDRLFHWCVRENKDRFTHLSFLSEDRNFFVVYPLARASSSRTPMLEVRGQ